MFLHRVYSVFYWGNINYACVLSSVNLTQKDANLLTLSLNDFLIKVVNTTNDSLLQF